LQHGLGKKLNHASCPGLVYNTNANDQLLITFSDKAFTWCPIADLKLYEPYFLVAKLYDNVGDNFATVVETSLDEVTHHALATLTLDHSSVCRPIIPADFIRILHGLIVELGCHR
jgi:hypothetical protein